MRKRDGTKEEHGDDRTEAEDENGNEGRERTRIKWEATSQEHQTVPEPEDAGVRGGLALRRADLADLTLAERALSSPRRDPSGTLVGSSSGGGGGGSLGSSGSSRHRVSLVSGERLG